MKAKSKKFIQGEQPRTHGGYGSRAVKMSLYFSLRASVLAEEQFLDMRPDIARALDFIELDL